MWIIQNVIFLRIASPSAPACQSLALAGRHKDEFPSEIRDERPKVVRLRETKPTRSTSIRRGLLHYVRKDGWTGLIRGIASNFFSKNLKCSRRRRDEQPKVVRPCWLSAVCCKLRLYYYWLSASSFFFPSSNSASRTFPSP